MEKMDKRLIWDVATFPFWGSLRIHEILSEEKDKCCPDWTMVWGDIKLEKVEVEGKETILIKLKIINPKESEAYPVCVAVCSRWRR